MPRITASMSLISKAIWLSSELLAWA